MSYPRLRALYERALGLDRAARDALFDAEAVAPELRAELEAMLADDAPGEDAIAAAIDEAARRTATAARPDRLGPWRVLGLLGEGGMGTVWLAERADGEFEKTVAIKLIRGHASAHARERFRRERQLLAALDHPDIAALLDAGSTEAGEPYLVMEYIDGETLPAWLARAQPSLDQRMKLFAALCRAVAHAHQHLVVHRDLKPSNILVRADGRPALLDFGIARLVEADGGEAATASRVMTPAWASPEQLLGRAVTTATDVYALGLVLYELLAGRVPPRGDVARAASVELPPPSRLAVEAPQVALRDDARRLRGDLDRIARRAVRTDPTARYPSALALAADIDAWREGRPVAASGTHAAYVFSRFVRRHRIATAAVGTAMVAAIVFAIGLARERDRARAAEANALREATVANETTRFLEELFAELDPNLHPGRALSARELLDIGRERLSHLSADSIAVRTRLQRSLGGIYSNVGEPAPAIELLEASNAAPDEGSAPLERVRSDTALSRAYYGLRRFEPSLAAAERAVTQAQRLSPADDRALAHALMTRGVAQQSLGRADAALADYDRAQTLFERLGSSVDVASVIHNRAWLAETRGDAATALALYDRALAEKRVTLSPDHPKSLSSLHGRGKMLAALGRHAESIAVREELVERSIRVHGERTQPVQSALGELASALQDAGRHAEAEPIYLRALAVTRAVETDEGLLVATVLNNLGTLREERGAIAAAEADYRHSLQLRRARLPDGHPALAVPAHNLARLLLADGRHDEALALATQALALRRDALSDSHPLTRATRLLLAQIALARHDPETAREGLAMIEAALADAPDALPALRTTALETRARIAAHDRDGAARIAALRAAIASAATLFPPQHPRYAQLQLALAEALLDAGDHAAAAVLVAALSAPLRAQLVPEAVALQRVAAIQQRLRPPHAPR